MMQNVIFMFGKVDLGYRTRPKTMEPGRTAFGFPKNTSIRCPINGVETLLSRAFKIYSNYSSLHVELEFVNKFFISYGYPSTLIESQSRNLFTNKFVPQPKVNSSDKQFCLHLPFFGAHLGKLESENFTCCLNASDVKFKILLVNTFSIGTLFKFKDTIPGVPI